MFRKLVSFVILLILFSMPVYAHQGKTDSKGGHYDRQNGGYHYHHGYPAHEHKNGECPYDFETVTRETKKGPSEEKLLIESNKFQYANKASNNNKNTKIEEIVASVLGILFLFFIYIGLPVIIEHKTKIKNFFIKIWRIICDFYTDNFEIIWMVIIFVGMFALIAIFGGWLDTTEDSQKSTTQTFYYENIDKEILNPPAINTLPRESYTVDWESLLDPIIEPKKIKYKEHHHGRSKKTPKRELESAAVHRNRRHLQKGSQAHKRHHPRPNNPAYDPRFFTNEEISSTPIRILGKVVELRRKF